MKLNLRSRIFFFAAMLIVFTITAAAQTTGISGTVTDQNGAAVPGATVTLLIPDKGFSRTTTTGDDGKYNFPTIPPDTYRLEVESANFKKLVNPNLRLLVDSPIEVNLTLEPGAVTAVVEVTANTIDSVINNQDATIGNNFVPEQITDLPTNLRRVSDLLSLQPGVTRDGYVAGGRSDQANITLDGVDINDQQTGGRTEQFQTTQNTVLRLTAESVEEFRITTVGANANQGRSSGAQISLITKGGTNDFHGAIFYFYRPTAFSSNDFFSNLAGVERGSLARSIPGGAIGGPILKDKLFFFYSYEGQREKRGVSVLRTVPLPSLGMGQLKFMGSAPGDPPGTVRLITLSTAQLNSIYSQVGINPAAVSVFAGAASRYPSNTAEGGDGLNTGGFRFISPTTDNEDTHIARFDYNINSRQSLFIRGNLQNDNASGVSQFPDTPQTTLWEHPYGFVVGHSWSISNNLVNNFRYGLTRQAFTEGGDSTDNNISFRFVYSPRLYDRTLSRVTPTQNFTNDLTWIKGGHTIQFGGNARIIRNDRVDFASAYDSAVTNPSFYDLSGRVVDLRITGAGYTIAPGQRSIVQNAATALIGRFSQYSGNFTFDIDGSVETQGTPTMRRFATEEYDAYVQDVFRPFSNLTVTAGLRYALSRPVYEKNGFQVVPTERLGDFFERRVQSAAAGVPLNDLINFRRAGPKNDSPGFYSMDTNNFQPRVAVAWSPNFKSGFLNKLFGDEGQSVFRGGFGIFNDFFGQQLAVSFNELSTIGFTSEVTISANTYNVTNRPAPQFTGFSQNIRSLPGIPVPTQRFMTEPDEAQRIETSLDATIVSPIHYNWNASFGRQLPKGMYIEASYVGRKARNLLAARDVMALNNLVDRGSGMDWYTAAGILHDLRARNTPITAVPNIPYFQNLFPGLGGAYSGNAMLTSTQEVYFLVAREGVGGLDILDWTFIQLLIDDDPNGTGRWANLFFHPQYAAFSAFSSVARSDYHGGILTFRQRLGEILQYDINYTISQSKDDASGLQTGDSYGSQFILNPLRPEDNYAPSDFDRRHVLNANFRFDVPFGRGKKFFSDLNRIADVFLGGWSVRGIYRWNSGAPLTTPFDQAQWATNWNVQSSGARIRPLSAGVFRSTQNIFGDPKEALNSFRNARPGETGERNVFRLAGFQTFDLGLGKTFAMPWGENHKLEFRAEVFNITNTQYFDAGNFTRTTYGLPQDPETATAAKRPDGSFIFGNIYDDTQGENQGRRFFQFGFRYSF